MEDPLLPLSTHYEDGASTVFDAQAACTSTATACHSSPTASTGTILIRLASLILLASVTVWANHEESKGFHITIVNDARGSDAGKRFDLLFVSNDRAKNLILDASSAIEQLLYPDPATYPKKPVQLVALRLARHNLSDSAVTVSPDEQGRAAGGFVIQVSPSEVIGPAAAARMAAAVYRGMARVWLWDRETPVVFVDAVVEHLSVLAGSSPPIENRLVLPNLPNAVADHMGLFLRFCDAGTRDFIPRLNQAMRMRNVWSNDMERLLQSSSLQTTPAMESARLCESVLEPAGTSGGVTGTRRPSAPRCNGYSCAQ